MNRYQQYGDDVLLHLMKQDNKAAFTELYDRYWERLFVIAYNRLKDREAAEDSVHDVFAGLWANRSKLQIDSLRNYLAVAVKYSVLARIRKKMKEQEFFKADLQFQSQGSDPEPALHHKELLLIIQAEVEQLPEKCRIIFKYSREKGMPVREIAEVLHLSPKTVENQLTKALRQLRFALRSFLHFLFVLF